MSRRILGIDRILVLTGICFILIFFTLDRFTARTAAGLGGQVTLSPSADVPASPENQRLAALEARHVRVDPLAAFAFAPQDFAIRPDAFHLPAEVDAYLRRKAEGGSAEDVFAGVSAPSNLRWTKRIDGLMVQWDTTARDAEIASYFANHPTLEVAVRLYRWRAGEEPAVVASTRLDQTSFLDANLGPAGGPISYSAVVVLLPKNAPSAAPLDRRSSDVLTVDLESSFDLQLLSGAADRVTVQVTVGIGRTQRTAAFEVAVGDRVGDLRTVDGQEVDFRTGLVVAGIQLLPAAKDEVVRHPVFNPDGSRAADASGFRFRDEVRSIPIQRLEVRCVNDQGKPLALSLDLQ